MISYRDVLRMTIDFERPLSERTLIRAIQLLVVIGVIATTTVVVIQSYGPSTSAGGLLVVSIYATVMTGFVSLFFVISLVDLAAAAFYKWTGETHS